MKKILCLLLTLICILIGLCGCNSDTNTIQSVDESITITENETNKNQVESSTDPVSDSDSSSDITQKSSGTSASNRVCTSSAKNQTTTTESKKQNSNSKGTTQDKYKTDPVPDGKPLPKEPESQTVDTTKSYTCTLSIECSTILDNLDDLDSDKLDIVPKNGVILASQTVTFYDGESVYDVLQRVCKKNRIHMESSWTPMYNSAYVEGINNLYEFDCGSGSGWMYQVNGWYPNYGCSRYTLKQGDKVEWHYTCNLGKDIGGGNAVG